MEPNATNLEVSFAFFKLHKAGRLFVLEAYAARYIEGTSFPEPMDLVQEAITRALERSREWPLRAPFAVFMCLAMRSIAQSDRERNGRELSRSLSIDDPDAPLEIAPKSATLSPDELLAIAQELEAAAAAVKLARQSLGEEDIHANRVIDGIVQGMAPREIRERWEMSALAFDAARHRAGRSLRDATERALARLDGREATQPRPAEADGQCSQAERSPNPAPAAPKRKPRKLM